MELTFYAGKDGAIIAEAAQAVPAISVSSGGLITAEADQAEGYVTGGVNRSTEQLPVQSAKTVTPTTTDQTVVESGKYTTGAVKVKGDTNLKAENIAAGVSIFGVTGTLAPEEAPEIEQVEQAMPVIQVSSSGLITASAEQEAGLVSAGTKSATKQLTIQGTKTVTPSTAEQTAVSAGVYTTGAVKVAAMPTATQAVPSISVDSAGKITASATQSAGYVAAGTKSATKQLSAQAAKTVTPTTTDQTVVESGKYTTGAVKVKGDTNLKAENIAAGVSIFGVTGTLAPEEAPEIEQVEQAVPVIQVSSSGLITASAEQEAGLVAAGTKSATKQLTTQGTKTVTPSTTEQTAVSAGVYTTGVVKVAAMPTTAQAVPSISVDSAGKITASATQSAGYVAAGTKSATKELTTQAAKTVTPTTAEQTAVPVGVYTTGAVKVAAMPTATQAVPSISVDSAGKITASATQSAGYVAAGTKSATKQLSAKSAATYTPGTSDQFIAAGQYLTGAQTVKGDANLKAENIAEGVSIFGVTGTHAGGGGGGAVETCIMTYLDPGNAVYGVYLEYDSNTGRQIPRIVANPGVDAPGGGTFYNVVKDSLFALYIGDFEDTFTNGAELVMQENDTFLVYQIKENCFIEMW